MLATVIAALSFAVPLSVPVTGDLVPGDGVRLDSVVPAVSPVDLPRSPQRSERTSLPYGYGTLAGVGALGGAAALRGRRRRRSSDPVYVLVPGYGGSPSDFDALLERLGVDRADTVAFDYRTVVPLVTSAEASRVASTEVAARRLDELIRELAIQNDNIYSLHHSKGGAVGVSMIAALDDGTRPPIDGYRGAALLDPAIASGFMGSLQRAGRLTTLLPDNGGFNPVRCSDGSCRDIRDHLGESSGVEVVAIRNPDALVTNFSDDPEHLRVYDLVDDGGNSALFSLWSPLAFVGRVSEAHGSVLQNWAVADCIKAEVSEAGSCVWKGSARSRWPLWGSGNSMFLVR